MNASRFKEGDRVVDLATGTRGVVKAARRDEQIGGAHYAVTLSSGVLVVRGDNELIGLVPVAAAPAVAS